jgi:hypothetical protein
MNLGPHTSGASILADIVCIIPGLFRRVRCEGFQTQQSEVASAIRLLCFFLSGGRGVLKMLKDAEIKKIITAFYDCKAAFELLINNLTELKEKLVISGGPEKGEYYRIVFKDVEKIKSFLDEIKKLQK